MRFKYFIVFCVVIASLTACKSNEANYRAAYERVMDGKENTDFDGTIYSQIRKEFVPGEVKFEGQTIPTGHQFVAITENGGGIRENIKRYCVVAGQFKQVFNARSMRERLVDNGYPGAFVVQTREPYYFVVAGSFSDLKPAAELYNKLKSDQSLMLKDPVPFVLMPSQIK